MDIMLRELGVTLRDILNINQETPEEGGFARGPLCLGASADGKLMPLLALFAYKRIPQNILLKYPWAIGRTDSGWMTSKAFYEYVANQFEPFLMKENITRPVAFFLDGRLKREDFGPVLEKAIKTTLQPEIIQNGFRKAGLYPFDENAVNYEKIPKSSAGTAPSSGTTVDDEQISQLLNNSDFEDSDDEDVYIPEPDEESNSDSSSSSESEDGEAEVAVRERGRGRGRAQSARGQRGGRSRGRSRSTRARRVQSASNETHLVGTIRKNRRNLPKKVVSTKLKKGEFIARESRDGITAMKWRDKRDVLVLSTKHSDQFGMIKKRRGTMVMKPQIIIDYNKAKGAVDLSDQMAAYSSPLRKSVKWYKKLAVDLLLNTAMIHDDELGKAQDNLVAEPNQRPKREKHCLEKKEGLARKVRRTCRQCNADNVPVMGSKQAKTKSINVSTYCQSCPTKPFFCLPCFSFNKNHK
ncbi:unnamed protein product [Colias eurytheme]|nr:unnamed protein product [Colias eurytheme]